MSLLQKLRSVRAVLTLWYTTILLIAFLVFGASVYVYLSHLQGEALEKDLLEEVGWIASLIDLDRDHFSAGEPPGRLFADVEEQIVQHFTQSPRNYIIVLTTSGGEIIYRTNQGFRQALLGGDVPSDQPVVQKISDGNGGDMRVAGRRIGQFVIRVAYTESIAQGVRKSLLSIFAVLVPVVLFIAIAGGWVMAGVVLRPVGQITELADRITAEHLNERIPSRVIDDELGRLIKTINGMITRLESSFEQIKQFSLSVAHELKTPLTILKGESELALAKSMSADEAQQLANTYLEETIRLSRIVEDLLTLAKAETKELSIQREPVRVDMLMEEVYDDATILAANKELTIVSAANEAGTVLGDPVRLRQLFRALVSNAIRYTDPGGTIRLSCRCEPEIVRVDIEDTGIGIPAESLDKIFDRLYRVDEARSRAKGGSGLGLSIARWIAEAHNGTISVVSAPGQGSTFTVRLPRVT
jgi:two-component system OmpR family sensor kinase